MEENKVIPMKPGKTSGKGKSKEAAKPVEAEPVRSGFSPANAEELAGLLAKLPLTVLDYKQYLKISDIQNSLQKIVEHYRNRAQEILKAYNVQKIQFGKEESEEERNAARDVLNEYHSDAGVVKWEDLKVLSADSLSKVFDNQNNPYSFAEFRALEEYMGVK